MEETKRKQLAELLSDLRKDIKKELVSNELALQMNGMATSSIFSNPAMLDEELRAHLQQANNQYHTAQWIPDSRFPLGRPLLKKALYRLLGFYTARQTNFNSLVVRVLSGLAEKISRADRKVEDLKSLIDRMNSDIEERFSAKVEEPSGTSPFENSYFLFADKFRGEEKEIKKRFAAYLEYFRRCKNLLEIGCGRGEFLELCAENSIKALGIDTNEDMILYCLRKGLQARRADALSYLKSLPDKSLDGVFMAYVAEHLPPPEFVEVLYLAYEKLQFGSHLIIKASNPACLLALANNFYLDLRHIRPIHPQALEFLLESRGFRNIKIEYVSPVSDEARLQKLNPTSNGVEAAERERIDTYNQNIDKLNNLLFGYQSYVIVAKK